MNRETPCKNCKHYTVKEVKEILELAMGEVESLIPSDVIEQMLLYLTEYEDMKIAESWRIYPESEERLYTHEEAWGTCDYIRRADAIDAIIAEGRTVDSRYLESERIVHECDAVEALAMLPSARPTDGDLISRADAIKRFCEFGTSLERQGKTMITMVDAKYAFIEILESLPSADITSTEECIMCQEATERVLLNKASAEVEWIPITTSEPTTSDHVLVTYNWGDDDYDDYEVSELDYWVTKCAAEEGNKQCQMFIDHVIAWSFMPQPYKER